MVFKAQFADNCRQGSGRGRAGGQANPFGHSLVAFICPNPFRGSADELAPICEIKHFDADASAEREPPIDDLAEHLHRDHTSMHFVQFKGFAFYLKFEKFPNTNEGGPGSRLFFKIQIEIEIHMCAVINPRLKNIMAQTCTNYNLIQIRIRIRIHIHIQIQIRITNRGSGSGSGRT